MDPKLPSFRYVRVSFLSFAIIVLFLLFIQSDDTNTFNPGENRVPNVVRFVLFGHNVTFNFLNYLSVLSVYRVQKPDSIVLYVDYPPVGEYWMRALKEIPILRTVHTERPIEVKGQLIHHVWHSSDVARIQILLKEGGIYLDLDIILIQPLDQYLKYPCTMGLEKRPKLISAIIIAEKQSKFLKLWYEYYEMFYRGEIWDYNSAVVPATLSRSYPHLIHVEKWRFTTPDWTDQEELLKNNIDWRSLALLHLMGHRTDQSVFTPESILRLPGIIGSVMRNAYYGDPNYGQQ